MNTGTVKWFSVERGYGFITPDDGSADLFAHSLNMNITDGSLRLYERQRVSFDIEHTDRGPYAVRIRPIGETFAVRVAANSESCP